MRVFIFILLFISFGASAQDPFSRDFWLNEANAPVKVNTMMQDASGYMWLGTDVGIFYFNGRNFNSVTDNIHKPVSALAWVDGKIWAGYVNGMIGFVENDVVKPVAIKNLRITSAITQMHSEDGHIIWISTEQQGVIVLINDIA